MMNQIGKKIVSMVLLILMTSCASYSIRLRSINGAPQPDPVSNRGDYYRGMQVVEVDTVIKIDAMSKDFTYLIKTNDQCKTGKLHSVEFKNTFGGSMLSTITFGKKRKMKVKYVCMKPTN
ncbi:hypothetical protein [Algibacter mikhailovii]|uniref:Lipoprotein n=1 Tax=Algibacter mikhailovii TaxID=425498 RepID=A0A918RBZ8_9FLAO|nr:hypothetical protein [Algibacter mikhailovii]GGZ91905.1 hypothetical protein GCM10007028_32910 [Algibacter mikhailovii]